MVPPALRQNAASVLGRALGAIDRCQCSSLHLLVVPSLVEGDLDRSAFETSKPNDLRMKLRRTEPYYKVGGWVAGWLI